MVMTSVVSTLVSGVRLASWLRPRDMAVASAASSDLCPQASSMVMTSVVSTLVSGVRLASWLRPRDMAVVNAFHQILGHNLQVWQ